MNDNILREDIRSMYSAVLKFITPEIKVVASKFLDTIKQQTPSIYSIDTIKHNSRELAALMKKPRPEQELDLIVSSTHAVYRTIFSVSNYKGSTLKMSESNEKDLLTGWYVVHMYMLLLFTRGEITSREIDKVERHVIEKLQAKNFVINAFDTVSSTALSISTIASIISFLLLMIWKFGNLSAISAVSGPTAVVVGIIDGKLFWKILIVAIVASLVATIIYQIRKGKILKDKI